MLTVDIDPKAYREKAAECRLLIADRQSQLSTEKDPLVAETLKRTVGTLEDMLSTYEKIASNLEEIRRLDSRHRRPLLRVQSNNR